MNVRSRRMEATHQISLGRPAGIKEPSHFGHVAIRELGIVIVLPVLGWMVEICPESLSTFLNHVLHVVVRSAGEKMIRVNAERDIARVQDVLSVSQGPSGNQIGNNMGAAHPAFPSEGSVSAGYGTGPHPMWAGLIYMCPESLFGREIAPAQASSPALGLRTVVEHYERVKSAITIGVDVSIPTQSSIPGSLGSAIEKPFDTIPTTMDLELIPETWRY